MKYSNNFLLAFCLSISVLLMCNCSQIQDPSKEYQYIQVDRKQRITSGYDIVDREPEAIFARNDSVAYMEAFQKFNISAKVGRDILETEGTSWSKPLKFKLIDPKGKNIRNTVSFMHKDSLESDLSNSILSMSNSLAIHKNKKSNILSVHEFGEKWPFIVDEGEVRCVDGMFIVFSVKGIIYAVNGTARSAMKKNGWRDVYEIWKDNPELPDSKISISPIIDRGLELCK